MTRVINIVLDHIAVLGVVDNVNNTKTKLLRNVCVLVWIGTSFFDYITETHLCTTSYTQTKYDSKNKEMIIV